MRCLKGQLFKVQLCEDNERYNWDIFDHQTKGVSVGSDWKGTEIKPRFCKISRNTKKTVPVF